MLYANSKTYAHATTLHIILFTNFTNVTKRICRKINATLHCKAYCRSVTVTQYLPNTVRILPLSTSLSQSIDKTPYLTITLGCQCCKVIIQNKRVQQHCTKCTSHCSQTSLRLQKDGQNLIFIEVGKNLASQESQFENILLYEHSVNTCINLATPCLKT